MSIGGAIEAGWQVVETWLGTACDVVRGVRREAEPLIDRLRRREVRPASPPADASRPERNLEEEVREAKYPMPRRGPVAVPSVASVTHPGFVVREMGPLPASYGSDRIVILARDPSCLFAYWELTPASRMTALGTLGAEAASARLVLRVDEMAAVPTSLDVEPPSDAANAYLIVAKAGVSYQVEVGLRTASGRFLPLARSNTVTTPAAQPSADTTVSWVELRTESGSTNGTRTTGPASPEPGDPGGVDPEPPGSPAR